MYPPHLFYLKEKGITWFNPSYGICGFWNEYRKLKQRLGGPHDYIWSHRDLKKAKEIYAMSILAKAVEKMEKVGSWWVLKPKNDPPDGVIGNILKDGDKQLMRVREVEVVEHISGDILDTLRKKLSSKQYEPNTILVCFISSGGIYDLEKKSKYISNEITSLSNIFLVFLGTSLSGITENTSDEDILKEMSKVSSVQIKPRYSFISIDPTIDCRDWREGKESNYFIYEGLGKGENRQITLENPPKLF